MLLQQFERVEEAWDLHPESVSTDYRIGPFLLRIAYGPALKKLTRAFSHLEVKNKTSPVDLTICLWDARTEKRTLPSIDWHVLANTSHYDSPEGPIYFHFLDSIEALSLVHMRRKKAYYIVRDGAQLPWWVEGIPLQAILHAYLQQMGLQLAHTAAIGNEMGALLLAGKGGSGKSTTTLSCVEAGWHYVGEDHAILEGGDEPRVWSIYHSAKWKPHTRTLFTQYESHIVNPETANREKALLFYGDLFPKQMRLSLPIRGIVSLSVGKQENPLLASADASSAIQNLMMSTLQQLPFCGPHTVAFFQKIGQSVPCHHLLLGHNLKANVRLLNTLLHR